jgi:hypothetical protein
MVEVVMVDREVLMLHLQALLQQRIPSTLQTIHQHLAYMVAEDQVQITSQQPNRVMELTGRFASFGQACAFFPKLAPAIYKE